MNIAVIFAGGVGSRMNSKSLPKQFLSIHGKPIIIHTLEKFEHNERIDGIVVACVESWMEYLQDLIDTYGITKVKKIVSGGATGQLSIYNGLCAASELTHSNDSVVLIHDGVRPFITSKLINDNIDSVVEHGSAITSVAAKETVLMLSGEGNKITNIPDRSATRLARAPQSFYLKDILEAHRKVLDEGLDNFIDSCSLMQYCGHDLYLVDGPMENIKITTPEDFYTMRALLDAKENEQIYGVDIDE
ncbi:2-C-methyl-D-erythritol 4-phosphate cytidylyltransferase [Oscillospiraceae bacterium]|nr:2-C-methyl-D-erythritol 4-phosphate cytidylyltransferase [Oscillospiraceae bacterium]